MHLFKPLAVLAAFAGKLTFALPQGADVSPATFGPAPVAITSSSARVLPEILADQAQVVVFAFGSCMTDAARTTYNLFHGSSGCVPVTNRGSITHIPATGWSGSYCIVRTWSGSNCQGSSEIINSDECRTVSYAAFSYQCA